MKKLWLLATILVSQLSYAGLIMQSDKAVYSQGESIQFNVAYQVDDPQTFTEITDFDFSLSFDNSIASYNQLTFSSPYDSATWSSFYDDSANLGSAILFDFSINPFQGNSNNLWDLFSVTFTAADAGFFNLSLDYLDLYDYNLNLVDSVFGFEQVEIVTAQVSEPAMISLSTLAVVSVFFMRRRKLVA